MEKNDTMKNFIVCTLHVILLTILSKMEVKMGENMKCTSRMRYYYGGETPEEETIYITQEVM
jgi:hypothetical protein